MAETKAQAGKAFDRFARDFGAKYPEAVAILAKDRAALLETLVALGRARGVERGRFT